MLLKTNTDGREIKRKTEKIRIKKTSKYKKRQS